MQHPIDIHVGGRIRERRALLGMTQTDLAETVGITFQQVQKYERGFNRISASRLFEFASVLDVPVPHFFEGINSETATGKPKPVPRKVKETSDEEGISTKRETLELVRAFYKIRDATQRRTLASLITAWVRRHRAGNPAKAANY